ncbi:MAG: hypothetical protein K8T25_23245, partial [Planctomycetia bacterium]|nr:hypothetical protein [Planctomycetia bacterium]
MGEGRPSTLPATRPGAGGGGEQRPGFRPDGGGNRPGAGGGGEQRPGFRPDGSGGQRPNFRPSTGDNPRDRFENRQDWAGNIRNNWHDHDNNFYNNFHNDFNHPGWCNDYPHLGSGYWNCHNHYAYGWWTWATPVALTGWWAGSGWGEPAYYDYGTGGNVYYQDDNVYVNGQQTATAADYAAQAQQLAASGAAQLEQTPAAGTEEQWMPLGMFAVSTSKEDESPLFIL